MRFVIRADAYSRTGSGHVMRTSVIAEELIDRGYEVFFVGNIDEIPWLREYISNLGFKRIIKPEEQFQANPKTDILILDSYNISITDPFIQPYYWKKTLVLVDDNTPSFVGDVYIHAGAQTSWTIPDIQASSVLLVGLEYLLIRKSLRKIRDENIKITSQNLKVLISAGGSDPLCFSQNVVNLLSKSDLSFHAFVLAPNFELPSGDHRFEFIRMGEDYEKLLNTIDLVLTTAGTSSWEYHFLGIPVALASAVENQERNYHYQISKGISLDLGYLKLNGSWELNQSTITTLLEGGLHGRFKESSGKVNVDGLGVSRILSFIL